MKYQALRPHFFSVGGWEHGWWWAGWCGGWVCGGGVGSGWVGDGVLGVGGCRVVRWVGVRVGGSGVVEMGVGG